MSLSRSPQTAPRPVDGVALQRVRERLQRSAQPPWLHGEVARRMAERLPLFKQQPGQVLDWWPAGGASQTVLQAGLPAAVHMALGQDPLTASAGSRAPGDSVDASARTGWLDRVRRWTSTPAKPEAAARVQWLGASALPAQGSADLVWANMLLHHVHEPSSLFSQWHDALAVGGYLMFSTLGPGSLETLRTLYRRQGWGEPMGPLVDMHDWGDMLVEAGFADPVMDQETLNLHWTGAAPCLVELRTLGANVHPDRRPGLRTPRWRLALEQALLQTASMPGQPDRVELNFEIVYGHAFKAAPRLRVAPETRVPVQALRDALRRSPSG